MTRVRTTAAVLSLALGIGVYSVVAAGQVQSEGKLTSDTLKKSLSDLGYETKDLNEKKVEIKITKNGFDVPIAAEISPSTNYIWLTVFLGTDVTDAKAGKLIRRNFKVQPSQFYVTEKGSLMMAIPVENRSMSNAVLRRALDKLSDDVVSTNEDWKD
ncbi:MAG: hypothetical protein JST30_08165 [Armatimonadetes bacterium]|nr:hypothetical protein [Armatimonadota bacterium]